VKKGWTLKRQTQAKDAELRAKMPSLGQKCRAKTKKRQAVAFTTKGRRFWLKFDTFDLSLAFFS